MVDGRPALATDGTPVDCVRFAALGLFGEPPDVVVSGVNLGLNLGDDVTYSGTVAAALEGVLLGVPSIAASQAPIARGPAGAVWDFRATADFVARLVPMASDIDFPRRVALSVNAPGRAPEDIRGARLTRLGRRIYDDELILEEERNGRRRYSIYGVNPSHHREDGTDFAALEADELSVTPIHFDLTDIAEMDRLERLQLNDLLGAEVAPVDR